MTIHDKLVQIQSELKAPKNQRNKFGNYNYRSCEDILEALKPHLKKHNLSLVIEDDIKETPIGLPYVVAEVFLSDGKAQVSTKSMAGIDPQKKLMDVSQTFGAASSYARKYALNGLFMIDDTKDADATNDHGKSPQPQSKKKPLPADRFKKAVEAYNNADDAGKKQIATGLHDFALTEGQIKEFYNQTKCKL